MTATADAQQIIETYKTLTPAPGRSMHFLPIYEMFDWTIARFHAALLAANLQDGVFVEPEPKLRCLTDLDIEISLKIGGEWKHTIAVDY